MQNLVLVPGLGSDAAVWARTIAALGDVARCSLGDTWQDDSLAGMASRILADTPGRFALAGLSMGGMVALEIMRAAPERVTGLALIGTNARPDTPEQAARRRMVNTAMLQATDPVALARPTLRAMVLAGADPSVHAELEEMTRRVGARAYVRQNEAVLARADLRPVLGTVTAPTLVMVGAQDAVTPLACSEEICDEIANAELQVVPDCGHLPPIETPRIVADLLGKLMSRAVSLWSIIRSNGTV